MRQLWTPANLLRCRHECPERAAPRGTPIEGTHRISAGIFREVAATPAFFDCDEGPRPRSNLSVERIRHKDAPIERLPTLVADGQTRTYSRDIYYIVGPQSYRKAPAGVTATSRALRQASQGSPSPNQGTGLIRAPSGSRRWLRWCFPASDRRRHALCRDWPGWDST